jgi:hypothetical protein
MYLYDYDDDYVSKVYIGNRLKPNEVCICMITMKNMFLKFI